ncbi:MAG: hypothetical protein IJM88_02650 [Bacteroidales bacterium]|nr:hypothetical protein [Bacteroidales bacterium]
MKRIVLLAAMAVFAMSGLMAQGNFKGTIVYTAASTGETAVQLNDQVSKSELKVLDNKLFTSSPLFCASQMADYILVDGRKQYLCMDLSMIFTYLAANDVELDYQGSSKLLVENEVTQQELDSLTIPVTEGFYIEYVAGETKTIVGKEAKKAIVHNFDDNGEDHPITIWYNDSMGPEVNPLFYYVRGVALEYNMNMGEGRQLTITASEIKEGKVKEVDMLLPSGYDKISEDDFRALFEQIGEEMKYLQEE